MASPHGIITRNMGVPPAIVSSEAYVPAGGRKEEWLGCVHLGDNLSLSPELSCSS